MVKFLLIPTFLFGIYASSQDSTTSQVIDPNQFSVDLWLLILLGILILLSGFIIFFLAKKLKKKIEDCEDAAGLINEKKYQFLTLAEGSPVGIVIIQDKRFRYVNSKFARIFGFTKSDLMDRINPDELIAAEDREGMMAYEQLSMSGEMELSGHEFKGVTKQGDRINAAFFGSSVIFSGRQALLGSVVNLSHRGQEEEEQQKRRNLESLGLLAGGIAHDFNNLLSVILGNASLLRSAPLNGPQEKYLGSLETATRDAGILTKKLNSFSKAEPIAKECVYLTEILDRVVESQEGSEGQIYYEIDIPIELDSVCGDGEQLWQVFSNILTNARQALDDKGHIQVEAELQQLDSDNPMQLPPGSYVKVSVKDNGVGIPKAALPKVFDPYFSTREIGHRGMGLGLTVAYAIVLKHGGSIQLLSEINRGTTVELTLPAWTQPEPIAARKEPEQLALPHVSKPEPSQTRVLFMDDEENILIVNEDYLDLKGYRVTTAREGSEAVDAYKQAIDSGMPFDVVVLDIINYRGLGGKETLAQLQEIDPNAKAIAISGYLSDSDMEALLDLGFKRLLRKPYDMFKLHQSIGEILAEHPD